MQIKNLHLYGTLFLGMMCFFSFGQSNKNFTFSKPMQLPFNLAGSFGEPRPDHFHSGIDIKTNGKEGEPVFSIYDGYISRIRVSPYGYGKSIYITHPNGYTSVYAHLSAFSNKLTAYIHQQHYKLRQSELDLTINANLFPVKQNDTIAFSGNTGGSTAPHLHFEIRDSKTEIALNPLDFYPKEFYTDTIPPQLNALKVYSFNNSFYEARTQVFPLKKISDSYSIAEPIIIQNDSIFCFSLEGFDKQDTSENKNGINRIVIKQNNEAVFSFNVNAIDFSLTRMCNAWVDYDEMIKDKGYFYNCYQLKNNTLPIYNSINKGFFTLHNNKILQLDVFCYDINNNLTTLSFQFLRQDIPEKKNSCQKNANKTITDSGGEIKDKNIKFSFPEKCFYDDAVLTINSFTDVSKSNVSKRYFIGNLNRLIPLQKQADIQFTSDIKENRNKIVLIKQNTDKKETALTTTFDNISFFTKTRELGNFYLKYDTTGPTIQLINLDSTTTTFAGSKIQLRIIDDLSGINKYHGFVDGHWVNFYYDAKNDVLEYYFDEFCKPGTHILKIMVTDKKENYTIFTRTFKQ